MLSDSTVIVSPKVYMMEHVDPSEPNEPSGRLEQSRHPADS